MQKPYEELGQANSDISPLWGSTLGGLDILSLAMIVHQCHDFYKACAELDDAVEYLSGADPSDRELVETDLFFIANAIKATVKVFDVLGIHDGGFRYEVDMTFDQVNALSPKSVWYPGFGLRANELARDYKRIRDGLSQEIEKHKFLYLPAEGVLYFDQEKLFGDAVYDKFPSTRYDIKESGNAFAFELYTACVFHLMRAVEHGLRAIANDRQVQLTTKSGSPYPLDMATWEEALRGLSSELEKVANWERSLGEVKVQAQGFYTSAIEELRAIKEWRNSTMHTRAEYLVEDASQIMAHVKRFMITISSRISETEMTPLIWTKSQLR